jgi:hypothetical protein
MATKKRGVLVVAGEWWRHLRPFWKRRFWKQHRRAEKRATQEP